MISLPITWLLSTIGVLATAIATLAGIMWSFMKSRLEAQDKIIGSQNAVIQNLQEDVERMAKGCGAEGCVWKTR